MPLPTGSRCGQAWETDETKGKVLVDLQRELTQLRTREAELESVITQLIADKSALSTREAELAGMLRVARCPDMCNGGVKASFNRARQDFDFDECEWCSKRTAALAVEPQP